MNKDILNEDFNAFTLATNGVLIDEVINYLQLGELKICSTLNRKWNECVSSALGTWTTWKHLCLTNKPANQDIYEITGIKEGYENTYLAHDSSFGSSRLMFWKMAYSRLTAGNLIDTVSPDLSTMAIDSTCADICSDYVVVGQTNGMVRLIPLSKSHGGVVPSTTDITRHSAELLSVHFFFRDHRSISTQNCTITSYSFVLSLSADGNLRLVKLESHLGNAKIQNSSPVVWERVLSCTDSITVMTTCTDFIVFDHNHLSVYNLTDNDSVPNIVSQIDISELASKFNDYNDLLNVSIYGLGGSPTFLQLLSSEAIAILDYIMESDSTNQDLRQLQNVSPISTSRTLIIINKRDYNLCLTSHDTYLFSVNSEPSVLPIHFRCFGDEYRSTNSPINLKITSKPVAFGRKGGSTIDAMVLGNVFVLVMEGPGKLTCIALGTFESFPQICDKIGRVRSVLMTRPELMSGDLKVKRCYVNDCGEERGDFWLLNIAEYPWFYNNVKILLSPNMVQLLCSFRRHVTVYTFSKK